MAAAHSAMLAQASDQSKGAIPVNNALARLLWDYADMLERGIVPGREPPLATMRGLRGTEESLRFFAQNLGDPRQSAPKNKAAAGAREAAVFGIGGFGSHRLPPQRPHRRA